MEEYNESGLRFEYPSGWGLEQREDDTARTVMVSSSETSFWCVSRFDDCPEPETVVEAVLEVFREDYEELDIYEKESEVFGDGTVARDLEFVCLELVNSAFLRSVRTEEFTLLVLYQGTDHELSETRELLEHMTRSLAVAISES